MNRRILLIQVVTLLTATTMRGQTQAKPAITDTTIKLTDLKGIAHATDLTPAKAKSILYKHFKAKGYWDEYDEQRKEVILSTDEDTLVVSFQELRKIKISGVLCGLVSYWITPYNGASSCYQPHKAIIVKRSDGYHICNEEFIPDRYSIDKILIGKNGSIISAYDYDCGNHINLRKLHIHLSKE